MQLYKSGWGGGGGGECGVGWGWRHTNNCVQCVRRVCHLFVSTRWPQLRKGQTEVEVDRHHQAALWCVSLSSVTLLSRQCRHPGSLQDSLCMCVRLRASVCVCATFSKIWPSAKEMLQTFFSPSTRPSVRLHCGSFVQVVSFVFCFFLLCWVLLEDLAGNWNSNCSWKKVDAVGNDWQYCFSWWFIVFCCWLEWLNMISKWQIAISLPLVIHVQFYRWRCPAGGVVLLTLRVRSLVFGPDSCS